MGRLFSVVLCGLVIVMCFGMVSVLSAQGGETVSEKFYTDPLGQDPTLFGLFLYYNRYMGKSMEEVVKATILLFLNTPTENSNR